MKKQKYIGLVLLLLVVVLAGAYMLFLGKKPKEVAITGLIGGEKIGLVENPMFEKQVKKEFGLTMDYHKDGSFAMVKGSTENYDYLWPSSHLALELFQKNGASYVSQDVVFNTPIVLYSRKPVVDALIKEGVAEKKEEIYYVDMGKLAEMVASGTKWSDIGLPELYGSVLVDTTDPNKSNSGNMFLGLLANSLNGGEVVRKDSLQDILPKVKAIYQKIGHMQSSSSDMFNQYMKQGLGAYPIIAGYENQLLEFSKQEPDVYSRIQSELVILYPRPTVWSSHVYIALTDQGKVGLEALKSKTVQELAWTDHGFRTITAGTADPGMFNVPGVPTDIVGVMPMPDIDTMLLLMDAIREE